MLGNPAHDKSIWNNRPRRVIEAMAEQKDNALNPEELLSLTSDIVAAHVSNNTVAVSDLPGLIEQVYKTLSSVGGAGDAA